MSSCRGRMSEGFHITFEEAVHIARVERDRLFANKLDELLTQGPSLSESTGKGDP